MPDATTDTVTDRVSTPLLTLITQQSLDEDYRLAAERHAGDPGRRQRPHRYCTCPRSRD